MKGVPGPTAPRTPSEPAIASIRVPFIQRGRLTAGPVSEQLFIIDLGVAGAFVERSEPLPVGMRADLEFLLPGNEIPIRVECRVAWWHPVGEPLVSKVLPAGVGLEFVLVGEEEAGRLRRHVLRYLRGDGFRRFHRLRPLTQDEDGARR